MTLISDVKATCDRLAPHGWQALLAHHGLNIGAPDLASELLRPLPGVDRTIPGFEDFAAEGQQGIEPRDPARSLLFHAFASPNVVGGPEGTELSDFPTPGELDAIENLAYGISPPSLDAVIAEAGHHDIAVVALAAEYRPALDTPHQRHADLCFSRTGVARSGTLGARYDGRRRGYLPTAVDVHQVHVLPSRFAAYLAVSLPGDDATFLPMRFRHPDAQAQQDGDQDRTFWVPVHKLFPGPECLRGLNLSVELAVTHLNEKLRRVHLALGPDATWREPDISNPPFQFTDGIAQLASDPQSAPGTVVPVPHERLVELAQYNGHPLTFLVPPNTPLSSSFSIRAEDNWRHGPEYVHARHMVTDAGDIVDLNDRPDVVSLVASGGYRALHYLDFTGDGWVSPVVPEIAVSVPRRRSAYSLVAAPDFFPNTEQRELTEWVITRLPSTFRNAIWPVAPDPLSDQRLPANIQLPGGDFRADEDTVTAIVSPHRAALGAPTLLDRPQNERHSHLPDDAAGVFAPGWDVSIDGSAGGPEHLAAYGLGSPFPEDSKLCAALSSFWPAVAPDAARTFEPSPRWPTVAPLTDEEIGSVGSLPWDGVPGPRLVTVAGDRLVEYHALAHADYVQSALDGRFTLSATAAITESEYQYRVLAMVRVYEALGVNLAAGFLEVVRQKARWTVLSFRHADASHVTEIRTAQKDSGRSLRQDILRFEVYQRGATRPHPSDVAKVHVEVNRLVRLLVDPVTILMQDVGPWRAAP